MLANDAIAVFDLNNKIIEVNPAFEQLYGWTKECYNMKQNFYNNNQLLPDYLLVLQLRLYCYNTKKMMKAGEQYILFARFHF